MDFVKDVWADVLATAGFLAVSGLGVLGHHFLGDLGLWTEIPLRALEFGGAVGALDHVARMVWERTFVGQGIRALWRLIRKPKQSDGDDDDDDDDPNPRRAAPPGRPPTGDVAEGGGVVQYSGSVLLHPPLGQFKSRLAGSAVVGFLAAVLYAGWASFQGVPDRSSHPTGDYGLIAVISALLQGVGVIVGHWLDFRRHRELGTREPKQGTRE